VRNPRVGLPGRPTPEIGTVEPGQGGAVACKRWGSSTDVLESEGRVRGVQLKEARKLEELQKENAQVVAEGDHSHMCDAQQLAACGPRSQRVVRSSRAGSDQGAGPETEEHVTEVAVAAVLSHRSIST